jgi:hypothetical protein
MELAAPHVDPHVRGSGHHVGIAYQAEPVHIEQRRELLIGDGDIDMLERNDIA